MADQPTKPSLLLRIRNSRDRVSWSQFVEIYAPLVYLRRAKTAEDYAGLQAASKEQS